MRSLTLQPIRRALKALGAPRVSDKAAEAFALFLEDEIVVIAQEAKRLADHAGRKTILKDDVRMARHALEKA